ncbi:type IX secretion system protein PorQ [Chitinophaga rhizophila]|uniref:Type IX secretion system protein PorQ n=1 Tax=Chitinophaga rhizophila TaxID=2866212 RepID=A0ABS7G9C9_9BACT|nr:type IX secretion system protein PorQ [Chitinophaga rhizophila]MBW8683910.1 type IX secretion system protein PorQ [Chitinophaga rhizophila]
MRKNIIALLLALPYLCCLIPSANAQVLGGKHVFSFLDLPVAPHIAALGSVNVSLQTNDIALSSLNPALLRPVMHQDLQVNYTNYFGGVKYGHALYGHHAEKYQTTFGGSVQYIDYGMITATDATGTIQGTFQPRDMAIQLTASRRYLERWYYGISMQYVHSSYQQYRASGLAFHVGLTYQDTAQHWQAGLVFRNMGVQLKTYTKDNQEPLPFDLQVGISKRLNNVPLQFSATIHHVHQFDVRYADPDFQEGTIISDGDTATTGGTADKIFRHFVLAAQWEIGRYIELTAAYNHLRRQELGLPQQKGMSGFSGGIGIITRKLHLRYARSWYQRSEALNQLGVSMPLKEWKY